MKDKQIETVVSAYTGSQITLLEAVEAIIGDPLLQVTVFIKPILEAVRNKEVSKEEACRAIKRIIFQARDSIQKISQAEIERLQLSTV